MREHDIERGNQQKRNRVQNCEQILVFHEGGERHDERMQNAARNTERQRADKYVKLPRTDEHFT